MNIRFSAFLGLVAALYTSASLACDPNEECNRCLASAFGNCITRGNDPVCEARKAACQVAPPVVNTPGSPFGPEDPYSKEDRWAYRLLKYSNAFLICRLVRHKLSLGSGTRQFVPSLTNISVFSKTKRAIMCTGLTRRL